MFWKKASTDAIGLVAGTGELPVLFANAAASSGRPVIAFGIKGLTDHRLKGQVDTFHEIELGHVSKLIDLLKQNKIRQVVLAGGIPKKEMYNPSLSLDPAAKGLLAGSNNKGDDHLLRAFQFFLKAKAGVSVVDARSILKNSVATKGVMTHRKPSAEEKKDIQIGYRAAKAIGRLDIGQTVVVKLGVVLAVEAIEGTDAAIRRGAELGNGAAVIVKTAKPTQDLRFDLPCIGLNTLDLMKSCGCSVLAVEAQKTLMLDPQKMIESADKAGLTLVGL